MSIQVHLSIWLSIKAERRGEPRWQPRFPLFYRWKKWWFRKVKWHISTNQDLPSSLPRIPKKAFSVVCLRSSCMVNKVWNVSTIYFLFFGVAAPFEPAHRSFHTCLPETNVIKLKFHLFDTSPSTKALSDMPVSYKRVFPLLWCGQLVWLGFRFFDSQCIFTLVADKISFI